MHKHLLALLSSSTPILPPFPLFFTRSPFPPWFIWSQAASVHHFAPQSSTSFHCEMVYRSRLTGRSTLQKRDRAMCVLLKRGGESGQSMWEDPPSRSLVADSDGAWMSLRLALQSERGRQEERDV